MEGSNRALLFFLSYFKGARKMKGSKALRKITNDAVSFVKHNSPTILTCIGAVGVVGTAVSTGKAVLKASKLLEEAKEEKGEDLTLTETLQVAGPTYIPAVLTGVATIACIFGANTLNKKKQAALLSAYTLLDRSYKDYKEKVDELYGEGSDRNVRNELAKDKYDDNDISVDDDKQLFYDELSERYFESTMEKVLEAEYELNHIIARDCGAFLNEFYELLGIDTVDYGDYMGWASFALAEMYGYCWVEFEHTKVVMDDGLECTIISMKQEPILDPENY